MTRNIPERQLCSAHKGAPIQTEAVNPRVISKISVDIYPLFKDRDIVPRWAWPSACLDYILVIFFSQNTQLPIELRTRVSPHKCS